MARARTLSYFAWTSLQRGLATPRLSVSQLGKPDGNPLLKGRGRGFAYHRSFNTRVAMVAEMTSDSRTIKVDRIVAAVDCGIAINPDIVAAQIEGAVGFALSSVLRN